MKLSPHLPLLVLFATGLSIASAQEPSLAKPLRKWDGNKDGKLTGEELTLARQAHNRGGRDLDFGPRQIKEMMERRKKDWKRQQMGFLDSNKDGKLDEAEERRAATIWDGIAHEHDQLLKDMMRKFDLNDDGELTQQEREASRAEFGQRRNAIEKTVMDKYRPAVVKPTAPATPVKPAAPTPVKPAAPANTTPAAPVKPTAPATAAPAAAAPVKPTAPATAAPAAPAPVKPAAPATTTPAAPAKPAAPAPAPAPVKPAAPGTAGS